MKLAISMLVAACALVGLSFVGAPPVTATKFFLNTPDPVHFPGMSMAMDFPQLPIGYNCTSVTVTISDWEWRRRFEVQETSGAAPGSVTFNAPVSQLGVCVTGPDGKVYGNARTSLPPFSVYVPAGGTYYNAPGAYPYLFQGWDQITNTQQVPAVPPVTITVPVTTPGFCEGPNPGQTFPNGNRFTVELDQSRILTQYASGELRTRQFLYSGGTVTITFNH